MLMKNNHIPVMLEEVHSYIPKNKKLNVIDATFGGGGYSKSILEKYDVNKLLAIDRDPISKIFAKEIEKNYPKKFKLINGRFSKIDELIKKVLDNKNENIKFDFIIIDLGLSSNQIEDSERGFSFEKNGPLSMNMGQSQITATDIINNYKEKEIADILYEYGQERYARKIARKIIEYRKINLIRNTDELVRIVKQCIPYKRSNSNKINPATRTFQALRIKVNDELNELIAVLNKSEHLLALNGKLLVVSFHSLEDKIVKDFCYQKSGKKWRPSRHYPELPDEGPITFKLITKKPIRPDESEININPRSRSAKLRVIQKINQVTN